MTGPDDPAKMSSRSQPPVDDDPAAGPTSVPPRRQALSRGNQWIAYVIGAFGLGVTSQVNFLVPLRAHELGAGFDVIGLIVGAGALAPALFSVPLGSLIDRLGPRRSFIVGTALCGLIAVTFTGITNYWALVPLQVLMGSARTLGWVASQGYITGVGRAEERATLAGRFSFFSNVGPMVGPLLIGGVAQLIGFRSAFVFLAGYAFFFTLLGLLLVETSSVESRAGRAKQGTGVRAALRLLTIRGIQVALLLTFVRLWIEWVWTSFFPVYLVDTGLDPALAGTVVFAKGFTAALLAPTTGLWTRFVSKELLTAIGLGFGAVGLLISSYVTFVPLVYLAPLCVGIGTGLSLPLLLSLVSDAAPDEQRGVALGLRVSVNQTAAAAAPVLVGPLLTALGIALAFGLSSGVAGLLLAASIVLYRVDRRDAKPG